MLTKVKGGTPNFGVMAMSCNYCRRLVGVDVPRRFMGLAEFAPPGHSTSKVHAKWECAVCGSTVFETVSPKELDLENPVAALIPTPDFYKRFGDDAVIGEGFPGE